MTLICGVVGESSARSSKEAVTRLIIRAHSDESRCWRKDFTELLFSANPCATSTLKAGRGPPRFIVGPPSPGFGAARELRVDWKTQIPPHPTSPRGEGARSE